MSVMSAARSVLRLYSPSSADIGGNGGLTSSGLAVGGAGWAGGGSALSGSTGTAYGGNVENDGYFISNSFGASQYFLLAFCCS